MRGRILHRPANWSHEMMNQLHDHEIKIAYCFPIFWHDWGPIWTVSFNLLFVDIPLHCFKSFVSFQLMSMSHRILLSWTSRQWGLNVPCQLIWEYQCMHVFDCWILHSGVYQLYTGITLFCTLILLCSSTTQYIAGCAEGRNGDFVQTSKIDVMIRSKARKIVPPFLLQHYFA